MQKTSFFYVLTVKCRSAVYGYKLNCISSKFISLANDKLNSIALVELIQLQNISIF